MPRFLERRYRQHFCSIRVELEPPTDMEREAIRTSLLSKSGQEDNGPSLQRSLMDQAYFTANVSSRVVVDKLQRVARELCAVRHVVSGGSRMRGGSKRSRELSGVEYSEEVMREERMDETHEVPREGDSDFIKLVGADVVTQTLLVELNGNGPSALNILRAACCAVSVIPSAAALQVEEKLLENNNNSSRLDADRAEQSVDDENANNEMDQDTELANARRAMSQRSWKRVCLTVTGTVVKGR